MPFILIDLRDKKEAEKGHLPKAISISLKELEKYKDLFPDNKKAPIYIYGLEEKDLLKGSNIIRSWGYTRVAILRDAPASWRKIGGNIEVGKIQSLKEKLVYIPKPKPGSFNIEKFKQLVFSETLPTEYFIIDIREPDEYQAGAFKFAKNIPLGELKNRLNEIPKDKTIIVHCVTGVRAEMGYSILKEAGFKNVYFVDAAISFED